MCSTIGWPLCAFMSLEKCGSPACFGVLLFPFMAAIHHRNDAESSIDVFRFAASDFALACSEQQERDKQIHCERFDFGVFALSQTTNGKTIRNGRIRILGVCFRLKNKNVCWFYQISFQLLHHTTHTHYTHVHFSSPRNNNINCASEKKCFPFSVPVYATTQIFYSFALPHTNGDPLGSNFVRKMCMVGLPAMHLVHIFSRGRLLWGPLNRKPIYFRRYFLRIFVRSEVVRHFVWSSATEHQLLIFQPNGEMA